MLMKHIWCKWTKKESGIQRGGRMTNSFHHHSGGKGRFHTYIRTYTHRDTHIPFLFICWFGNEVPQCSTELWKDSANIIALADTVLTDWFMCVCMWVCVLWSMNHRVCWGSDTLQLNDLDENNLSSSKQLRMKQPKSHGWISLEGYFSQLLLLLTFPILLLGLHTQLSTVCSLTCIFSTSSTIWNFTLNSTSYLN